MIAQCACYALLMLALATSSVLAEEPPSVLTLDDAITIVLSENPLGQIAKEDVLAAEHGRKAARGEFLPKLKNQFQFSSLSELPTISLPANPSIPVTGYAVGEGGVQYPLIAETVRTPSRELAIGDEQQITITTTLEQPLFTGMALLAQYQLANLDKNEAEIREESTRQGLIFRTHEAFFAVLVAERYLEVAGQAVQQLESHAEVAREFFSVGVIPKNDLLKVLVQLADTKQKRIEAAHRLDIARSSFNTLLRRDIAAPVRLKDILVSKEYTRSMEECTETALKHNPDVLLSSVRIKKADKGITLARSGFYPTVGLAGALLHEDGTFAEAGMIWSASVQTQWAIWEWGSNYYRMKQSQVRKSMAESQLSSIVDRVRLEVRQAYLSVQEWKEALEVAKTSIEQAEENFRITEERFKATVTTSTEVLDAQTMLAQARVNYYSALSNLNVAQAKLEQSMGTLKANKAERK